jgi:predicted metal-dependent hydrolase
MEYCPVDSWVGADAIAHHPGHLIVKGQVADLAACQLALQRWLKQKADQHLVPWLQTVSQTTQLPFDKAVIRSQKKRWASCSSHKVINLNCKLLLIPPPLVNYIFVHELCHTVHMNHSPQFWQLVSVYLPNYKQLDKALDQAWQTFPLWAR